MEMPLGWQHKHAVKHTPKFSPFLRTQLLSCGACITTAPTGQI